MWRFRPDSPASAVQDLPISEFINFDFCILDSHCTLISVPVICFPNAKINLGLHVMEKRPDGFHSIETVFHPVSLSDILEMVPSEEPGVRLAVSGIPLAGDPGSNLVMKAVTVWKEAGFDPASNSFPKTDGHRRDTAHGLQIHLHKIIPPGSGLGGGSSDGAATLNMLNEWSGLNLPLTELHRMAALLGSDCPFFIISKPAFATGRGEILEPVPVDLSAWKIVVEIPPVHVNTAEAYSLVTPRKPETPLREIIKLPVEAWKGKLINDFEEPVMNRYPVIREVREKLYHQGAVYAAMSGSGSAVFGLFGK